MNERSRPPLLGWLSAALAGVAAPAAALLLVDAPLDSVAGPILALGLMGVGMITAACAGRLWVGVLLALLAGTGLIGLARALGLSPLEHPSSIGLAFVVASVSFAARGALFARAVPRHAWVVALSVVLGEAAMLFLAAVLPATLPDELLVLLPAQWASAAIRAGVWTGIGTRAASAALLALGGTAATTLLVARLWPRRWPYALMFTAWLSLSALVWHHRPPLPREIDGSPPSSAPAASSAPSAPSGS